MNLYKGPLALVLATVIYGLYGVFSRMIGIEFGVFAQSTIKNLIVVILSLLIVLKYHLWKTPKKQDWPWIIMWVCGDLAATIGKIAYQIRSFKPDLIITTNPEDMIIRYGKNVNWVNHRDHRNCGKSVIDAAYPYARDLLFFPEHFKQNGINSHKTAEFLLTDYYNHPDLVYIDVTDYIDTRIKAHAAHSSQYSLKDARESANFFTKSESFGTRRFERFRYVLAD